MDQAIIKNQKVTIFQGPIHKSTIKLSLPIFFGLIFMSTYTFVDTLFLSQIDRTSTSIISAVALINPIYFFFTALGTGLSSGMSSFIARCIGDNKSYGLRYSLSSGLFIVIILSFILLTPMYFFLKKIIVLLAGSKLTLEAINYARIYLVYLIPGFGMILLGNIFLGILQGEGLNLHVAIIFLLSTLINIILDPIFIFVLKMGVAGAAFATSIAYAFTSIYVIIIFIFKQSSVPSKLNILYIKLFCVWEITRVGLLESLSLFSISISNMFFNNLVSSIGQTEMNSWGLCGRMDQIFFLPLPAISKANLTMIGQNYGRKNYKRVKKIYLLNIIYACFSAFVIFLLYQISVGSIFSIFSDINDVIQGSILQVRITAIRFFGLAGEVITVSTFQGMGKPIPAFFLIIIRIFILTIPISYFLVYIFDLGMLGIFLGISISSIVSGVICILWTFQTFTKIKV